MAVLSYHFWQGHYGGSPAAVGKTIQLDKENYTIIGVVPPRFEWFHSDLYILIAPGGRPRSRRNCRRKTEARGASRARLIRQLVSEAILLGAVGCLAGAASAQVSSRESCVACPTTPFRTPRRFTSTERSCCSRWAYPCRRA